MKKYIKLTVLALAVLLVPTGCATTNPDGTPTPTGTFLTNAKNFALTVAAQYEKANDGGVLTQAAASAILKATKSDATTTEQVLIATALADKVIAAGVAAHNAGATPAGVQAAQSVILSDPGVIATVATAQGS